MGIRRYNASKDTTITNAFKENLATRATDANMGASDALEVFSIYGQSTQEQNVYSSFLPDTILTASDPGVNFDFSDGAYTRHAFYEDAVMISSVKWGWPNQSGSIYFLEKVSTSPTNRQTWRQTARLTASDGQPNDFHSQASWDRENRRVAVGALGVNNNTGAVYVYYQKDDGTWRSIPRFSGSGLQSGDGFGSGYVDIKNDLLVVSAYQRTVSGTVAVGTVYIFRSGSTGWSQEAFLEPQGMTGSFAINFGLSGEILDAKTIAIGSTEDLSGSFYNGSVSIFKKVSDGAWKLQQKITPPRIDDFQSFSYNVKQFDNKLYISMPADIISSGLTGSLLVYASGSGGYYFEQKINVPGTLQDAAGNTFNFTTDAYSFAYDYMKSGESLIVGSHQTSLNHVTGGCGFLFQSSSATNGVWTLNSFYTSSLTGMVSNDYWSGLVGVISSSNVHQLLIGDRHATVTSASQGISQIYTKRILGTERVQTKEVSRILVQYPIEQIVTDRTNNVIPPVGQSRFLLKLGNVVHPFTLPRQYTLSVVPLAREWTEGTGMDMEQYLDVGYANWDSASVNTPWTTPGGDFYSDIEYTQYFDVGNEDLQVDVTTLVEQWINGTKPNFGVCVKLTTTEETDTDSYYTKKFSSRGSEFFFKRPWIEAQFDSSKKDNRNSFYRSSSLAPPEDNLNLLYLYNRHRGKLVNIPAVGTGLIYLSLYSGTNGPEGSPLPLQSGQTVVTGGYAATGLYTASVAIETQLPYVFDVWHNNAGVNFITGSAITVLDPVGDDDLDIEIPEYALTISNLKQSYSTRETARFALFVRNKEWSPTIYTVASQPAVGVSIEDAYFRLFRIADNLEIIPFGTGSMNHTRLSFDGRSNYFDLDMNLLEAGYSYGVKFTFKNAGRFYEQREMFKFRVDD